MLLTKVIEILSLNLKEGGTNIPPDCRLALSVAIEAVKQRLWDKQAGYLANAPLLPGETEL